jgi:restriction system protein
VNQEEREKLVEALRQGSIRVTLTGISPKGKERKPLDLDLSHQGNLEAVIQMVLSGQLGLNKMPTDVPSLSLAALVIPEKKVSEGTLIRATSLAWGSIVEALNKDWSAAYSIPPEKWEEIVAGAYYEAGFEVILTPRSGDHGRDIIAVSKGVGCIKLLGSVKAYAPGNLVGYDDIRALMGVLSGEPDASKGILSTTSDFPPNVLKDPIIAPFLPTRLELMNGVQLRAWLNSLTNKSG